MEQPFYSDPNVYTAATAVLALIVSLAPYVLAAWRGRRVTLTLPNQIFIDHYLGMPRVSVFMDISNTGAASVTIKKIDCLVEKQGSGKKVWHLPAQTYVLRQASITGNQGWPELLIGPIHLKPSENWQEVIRCHENISEEWENESQTIRTEIAEDIQNKQMDRQKQDFPLELIDADPGLVQKAENLFSKTFTLSRGEYIMYISAIDSAGEVLACQALRFLLFENDLTLLQRITKQYKHGFGIAFPPPMQTTIWPQPRVHLLDDNTERARQRYKTLLEKV